MFQNCRSILTGRGRLVKPGKESRKEVRHLVQGCPFENSRLCNMYRFMLGCCEFVWWLLSYWNPNFWLSQTMSETQGELYTYQMAFNPLNSTTPWYSQERSVFPFGELGQLGLRANMARVLPEPTRAKLAHDARVPTLKSQFLPRSLLLGCFEQWDD